MLFVALGRYKMAKIWLWMVITLSGILDTRSNIINLMQTPI